MLNFHVSVTLISIKEVVRWKYGSLVSHFFSIASSYCCTSASNFYCKSQYLLLLSLLRTSTRVFKSLILASISSLILLSSSFTCVDRLSLASLIYSLVVTKPKLNYSSSSLSGFSLAFMVSLLASTSAVVSLNEHLFLNHHQIKLYIYSQPLIVWQFQISPPLRILTQLSMDMLSTLDLAVIVFIIPLRLLVDLTS